MRNKIIFYVSDDFIRSSELIEFDISSEFDIPKNLSKLKPLCLAIAKLRGHTQTSAADIEIREATVQLDKQIKGVIKYDR